MVEFEDATLREADGKYSKVCELMKADGAGKIWMLKSKTFVHAETITGVFILNFWSDGKIVIDEILRPMSTAVPNDDMIDLCKWTTDNGWQKPQPADRLMFTSFDFLFWEQQYRSGLISCPALEQKENELLKRMEQAGDSDDQEENNNN